MSRRSMPSFLRAALIASLSGVLSLASCDLAGDEGGPGPSPGLQGSLPSGPLSTPFALDTNRATLGLAALQSNDFSYFPSLSGDGRYVVFTSYANNLVTADTNGGVSDIFLRDTQLGVTKLISVSTAGFQGNGYSYEPFISNNGRFVVYASDATNLDEVTPDLNNTTDIFLYDRDPDGDSLFFDEVGAGGDPDGAPVTLRVSLVDGGLAETTNGYSYRASVSEDGDRILFLSSGSDFVAGDTNGSDDVFVRIRSNDETRRVSVEAPPIPGFPNGPDGAADGSNLSGFTFQAVMNAPGTFAVYITQASDAVYGDSNGYYDVFRVNVDTLATDRVSFGQGFVQPNSYCYTNYFSGGGRSISDNGQVVSFSTSATNIVANDTNGQYDVFIRDYNAGTITRVLGPGSAQANSFTFDGRLTGDGSRMAFVSNASNFGPDGDFNQDIFIRNNSTGALTLASRHTNGTPAGDYCEVGIISSDGTMAAFSSYSSSLVDDDSNFQNDIFRRDLINNETIRVSLPSGAAEADAGSDNAVIAGSAPVVVFDSDATNLVAQDTNGVTDVFVRDIVTQTMKMVSVNQAGAPANGVSRLPSCSADGRFIAFQSSANDLVTDDFNGIQDIFVRDMAAGQTFRVSRDPAGNDPNGQSDRASISADGRFVAFESDADNLVANDVNGVRDVFVYDRQTLITVRVSVASDGSEATSGCFNARISANGRFVAFEGVDPGIVATDGNGTYDILLHDRDVSGNGIFDEAGDIATTRVSVGTGDVEGDGDSFNAALSADGQYIAFESSSTNLVAGDGNFSYDVFVHNRVTGVTTRVSVTSAGVEANGGDSYQPSISSDGRFVAFSSDSTDLVSGDGNFNTDVFVRDRDPNVNGFDGSDGATNRVSLAGPGAGTEATGGGSFGVSISGDGRWVGYSSDATNLAFPDLQGNRDVFVRGPLY